MKLAISLVVATALGAASTAWAGDDNDVVHMHHFNHHHLYHGHERHHSCVGLSSGTAHHTCGSKGGGPAGGLH